MNMAAKTVFKMRYPNNLILLLLLIGISGCARQNYISQWIDTEVTVDGHNDEWQGRLINPDNQRFILGAMNDQNYLYIIFGTTDRATMRHVARAGLTLWLDSKGGRRHTLGIVFPIPEYERSGGQLGRMRGRTVEERDMQEIMARLKATQLFLEVRGPRREDVVRLPLQNDRGLQVEIGYSTLGEWIYELRIPLSSDDENPIELDAKPGTSVGLGFEVGAVNRQGPPSGRATAGFGGRRGRGGGSVGGPGGGRRGSGFSRTGRGNRQFETPLKYWTRLILAAQE
jgi:hypothetical protein